MKKPEIADIMARQAGVSPAEAADDLDGVVRHILTSLRKGKVASWPGLGLFRQGKDGRMAFQPEKQKRNG